MSKRNILCQHINNVLCFFASRDPITKLKLMKAYCNSFYGSVLWDLANVSLRDVCIAWRKGLRRIWDLPHNTHCNLLLLLCDTLPLMDELSCRCATFITNVLDSDNDVVNCCTTWCLFQSDAVADWLQCCLLLLEIRCSVKKTLHLLRKLLFVTMFSMLSLLTLFILHAVY